MSKILWIDEIAGKSSKTDRNGKIIRLAFDNHIFFIEKNGHNVTIAASNSEIVDALNMINQFDLLILDIIMDPLPFLKQNGYQYGGIDILEYMVNEDKRIPIIILSVMDPQKIKDEALRRGLDLDLIGVKKILRKGSEIPETIAEIVEIILGLSEGE